MNNKKTLYFLVICFTTLLCLLGLLFGIENSAIHRELKASIAGTLTKTEPVQGNSSAQPKQVDAVVYILGGDQDSLECRFKTATELYNSGLTNKMLTLSRPGITEYDPLLRRNMTNDEWTLKKLSELGIKREDIELVPLENGMFGTLTEAKGISYIAQKKGYRRLILVTSAYHTKRTWLAFSKPSKDNDIILSIYGSNDQTGLPSLLLEYVKLILYKHILLQLS